MPGRSAGLVETLQHAMKVAEEERRGHEQKIQQIDIRIEHIRMAIEGEGGKPLPKRASSLGVAPDRLAGVLKVLEQDTGFVRQADVVEATGYNSGTVSIALRVLKNQGKAVEGDIERSSRTWAAVPASERPREHGLGTGEGDDDLGLGSEPAEHPTSRRRARKGHAVTEGTGAAAHARIAA